MHRHQRKKEKQSERIMIVIRITVMIAVRMAGQWLAPQHQIARVRILQNVFLPDEYECVDRIG